MAGSVNKVILVGNVGKDPEIRSTQDGTKIANLSIATSETWNDRASGERKEKTEWHRIVVFNEFLVTTIEKYVRKGAKLYVEGQLQTRKWTDQGGVEKYSTEVVLGRVGSTLTMLDGARDRAGGDPGASDDRGGYSPRAANKPAGARGGADAPSWDAPRPGSDLDDDIPF